jgi:ABC-type dipeptide/oligopeptide/nickel transport system permease component
MPVGCAQTVFNRPGSGGLMNLAIFRRDVPVLSAAILGIATQNQIAFASLTVCHAPR